ncbi:Pycsar system effector family protein [Seonamhaeicola maritimus]|uniref:Pycsar system effector family protein n=1 Tax=Seonamhaeicola maritimus TaxID=2591822 RepID=UPI0024956470|nr:Pycsar system effector family protein [Seonamhaeicola maritimus]
MEKEENKKPLVVEKNRHQEDLIDHYWGSINYILNLVKASEIKAGLILSFYGIILNFVFKSLQTILDAVQNKTGFYIISSLWFISTVTSIYYSIRCFMPRIEGKFDKNIFFFGDVINKYGNIKEFSKTFYNISTDEDRLFDQLGQQIYINSKIAAGKFKNINKSLKFLAIGLILMMILAIYYVINSKTGILI